MHGQKKEAFLDFDTPRSIQARSKTSRAVLLLLVLACPGGRAWAPGCLPARSPARYLHPVLCVTACSLKNLMAAAAAERPPVAVTLYLIRHGESRHNSASKKLDIGLPRPATPSLPEARSQKRARAYARARIYKCAHAQGVHGVQAALNCCAHLPRRPDDAVSPGELLLQQDHGLSLEGAAQVNTWRLRVAHGRVWWPHAP